MTELAPHRPLYCPVCLIKHERGANLAGSQGAPGALSMCLGCLNPLRFPEEGKRWFVLIKVSSLTHREYIEFERLKARIRRDRRRQPDQWDGLLAMMRRRSGEPPPRDD